MEAKLWDEILDIFQDHRFYDEQNEILSVIAEIDNYYGYDDISYCEWGDHYELNCFMLHGGCLSICEECKDNI